MTVNQFHLSRRTFYQLAQRLEAKRGVGQSRLAGPFQVIGRVLSGHRQ